VIAAPCDRCNGAGQVHATRRFMVNIPQGVRNGQKIRLAGQGQPGQDGGPSGDLFVEIRLGEHPQFRRKGNDVYSDVTVNLVQAALGARVRVPTIHGEASVRIPAGTQPGTALRLRGHGIMASDGSKGDHYVTVRVTTPTDLRDAQKDLLRQFAKSAGIPTD
jgi:molecular chaperone DnaJ